MPDDYDYADLGRLLEHPEDWTRDDLASAQSMLMNQKRAVDDADPRDRLTRQSLQDVVDALEAAIERNSELER